MFFSNWRKKKQEPTPKKQEVHFDFKNNELEELIEYLKEKCGIDLEPKKDVLLKKLGIFCQNKNIASFKKLLNRIQQDEELMQDLVNLVTVNETFFYRELAQLEDAIAYISSIKHEVKILCAPCSSGEEAYSLAFLAKDANQNNIQLTGIDISSKAIEEANKGLFSERSLHRLDARNKALFFNKIGNKYSVKKESILDIEFKVFNIFDDEFLSLGRFDIIFSRNMMIYFNEQFKQKAIKRFHEMLYKKGRLYTGHADLVPQNRYFKKVIQNNIYFYEKI